MDASGGRPEESRLHELRANLGSWNIFEFIILLVDIPLLLTLIFAFPQYLRDEYLIFFTSDPNHVPAYFFSAYTHSDLIHLAGNLALYYITAFAILLFESNRRRFRIMAAISFLLVPFVCTFLTIGLWHVFGSATSMQGFSGITASFLAYAFIAGVTWGLTGALEQFDRKESFTCPPWKYYISCVLLTTIVVLIVFLGILEGRFISSGSAVSNGIAHFGGFMTGLLSYTVIDLLTERRKNFDTMLIISIIVGIVYYIAYLLDVVHAVTGL